MNTLLLPLSLEVKIRHSVVQSLKALLLNILAIIEVDATTTLLLRGER